MSQFRDKKIEEIVRELAAKFFLEESAGPSLITVTSVKASSDVKYVTIYFTVYPIDGEKSALDFAKRKRGEFKEYVKNNSGIGRIPFFDFEIDLGEKNRQLIDDISNKG